MQDLADQCSASLPARRGGRQRPFRGAAQGDHVPCPSRAGCLTRTAPSGTAHRGEQWQKQRGRAEPCQGSGAGTVSCTGPLEHSPLGKPSRAVCPRSLRQASLQPARSHPKPVGRGVPCTAWLQTLTVVGEARFAQTHDKVHFHLVRSHGFGANGALETWRESGETSP